MSKPEAPHGEQSCVVAPRWSRVTQQGGPQEGKEGILFGITNNKKALLLHKQTNLFTDVKCLVVYIGFTIAFAKSHTTGSV